MNAESTSLSVEAAKRIRLQATQVFSPRGPVSNNDLFAGRLDQINQLLTAVNQVGLHVVVFGERGVGKTSIANVLPVILRALDEDAIRNGGRPRLVVRVNANANDTFASLWCKALDEIVWEEDRPSVGFRPAPNKKMVRLRDAFGLPSDLAIDDVRRTLALLDRSVFVFDEFDRLPKKHATQFTDLIKALSDYAIRSTIVIVGVADTIDGLVRDHASITRAIRQVQMPRMSIPELRDIITRAERALGIQFDPSAAGRIARMSQGLPHYTHLVGQMAVLAACNRLASVVAMTDVSDAFESAVKEADHTTADTYGRAVHSAQSGALYEHVLLACAITAATLADDLGFFQPASVAQPLASILNRRIEIGTFNRHLGDFNDERRGRVLERTGQPRSYRYRFRDPLLPPYVILRGIADGLIAADEADAQLSEGHKEHLPFDEQ